MHATIDVRFELSIDDDKTLPLATLAEAVTDQNLEAVLLESLVESLDAASVEALCGENTHMAAVTSASNAPAPTPAQLSQLPENTSSLSTTSKIQPLPQTNPATSGPSKTFSTSTGRTAISRTSPPKASISLPRSAIETLPITATASSRCRRRPPSTAVPEIRPQAQTVPSRLCRWHER